MADLQKETHARFSTGVQEKKTGPNFSWEHPVPDNDFWRSINYPTARNFLQCFTQTEADAFRLNEKYSAKTQSEKLGILTKILEERIREDEEKLSPGQRLWETAHAKWQKYMLALSGIYYDQGDEEKQLQVLESLIENRVDKSNLSFHHGLAGLLVRRGEFVRAEELEREVMPWLDGQLGKECPQSMASRRILAKAMFGQGRIAEAEEAIAEIWENIELMGEGQFSMYVDEEKKQTQEMIDALKEGKLE